MNEEKALEIFKKNIYAKPNKIERCVMGHGNYVYIISGETNKYVIRLSGEDNAYADTAYWLGRLREINIPVPEVLADGKYEDYDYIILSYIDGEDLGTVYNDLSNEDKRLIAKEVVAIQNSVTGLKLENTEVGWTWNSFIYCPLLQTIQLFAMPPTAAMQAFGLRGLYERLRRRLCRHPAKRGISKLQWQF